MPFPVIQSMKEHIDLEASIGGYEAAQRAEDKINNFYAQAARLINCGPDEIAFTENATGQMPIDVKKIGPFR